MNYKNSLKHMHDAAVMYAADDLVSDIIAGDFSFGDVIKHLKEDKSGLINITLAENTISEENIPFCMAYFDLMEQDDNVFHLMVSKIRTELYLYLPKK